MTLRIMPHHRTGLALVSSHGGLRMGANLEPRVSGSMRIFPWFRHSSRRAAIKIPIPPAA